MIRKMVGKMVRKISLLLVAFATFLYVGTNVAGTLSVPNSFSSGGTTSASDMNSNFSAVETAVNDNDTRITELETSSAPVFQGFSSSTLDGSAGILTMQSACSSSFSGAKVCNTAEVANSIYNSSASNLSGTAWVLPILEQTNANTNGYTMEKTSGRSVNGDFPDRSFTCQGWGTDSSSRHGFTLSAAGRFSEEVCSVSRSVACCK